MKKLLCILLAFTFLLLSGCGSTADKESANAVAIDFISAFQRQDFDFMYNLTADQAPYYKNAYNPDQELNVAVFKALAENMTYSITKTEIKGDEANVFYNLRTLNAESLMAGIIEDLKENPNDDINTIIERQIVLCPRKQIDTVINMDRSGDSWTIESNVGIYDDLAGGFLQFIYNAGFVK